MRRKEVWVKVPLEPALPWAQLPDYERMVGRELYMAIGQAQVIAGSMPQVLDGALRKLGASKTGRRRFRVAFEALQAAGLLLEHAGDVLLLYSREMWEQHRELSDAARARVQERNRIGTELDQKGSNQSDLNTRNHSTDSTCLKTARAAIDAKPAPDSNDLRPARRRKDPAESGTFALDAGQLSLPGQETGPAVPDAADAAPLLSKRRATSAKRDADLALLRGLLEELAPGHGMVAPTLGQRPLSEAVKRAREYAALAGLSYEQAARKLVGDAYRMVASGKSSAMQWALRDWQPGQTHKLAKTGVAQPASAEQFAASGTQTWAQIKAARAAREAMAGAAE